MSHYHFHNEKQITVDGSPKTIIHNYIVAKDFGNQEKDAAIAMGYAVKWNECSERFCFNEGLANSPR